MARTKYRRPLTDRFWPKVDKFGPVHPFLKTRCWLWTGCLHENGYGGIGVWRDDFMRREDVHRVAWELAHGPIIYGMSVLHRCDVRRCVRVDHLFLGTQGDNVRDCVAKGRLRRGEQHNSAKMTDDAVREIRSRYAKGGISYASLAAEYTVGTMTIWELVTRRTWAHVL